MVSPYCDYTHGNLQGTYVSCQVNGGSTLFSINGNVPPTGASRRRIQLYSSNYSLSGDIA